MYTDCHTHLTDDKLFPEWDKHMEDFQKIWWKTLINVWINETWSEKAINIKKEAYFNYPDLEILASIGFHPLGIAFQDFDEKDFKDKINYLENLYYKEKENISALWECWIDTFYDNQKTLEKQKKFFKMQCELANKLSLPLIIHSRNEFEETFNILKEFKHLKIYFHCRCYGPEEVKRLQENFPYIWIWYTGIVTFPKSKEVSNSLHETKFENLLLETDAPYLAPQAKRWKLNKPDYIKHIYEDVANQLDCDLDFLQDTVYQNFKRFLEN